MISSTHQDYLYRGSGDNNGHYGSNYDDDNNKSGRGDPHGSKLASIAAFFATVGVVACILYLGWRDPPGSQQQQQLAVGVAEHASAAVSSTPVLISPPGCVAHSEEEEEEEAEGKTGHNKPRRGPYRSGMTLRQQVRSRLGLPVREGAAATSGKGTGAAAAQRSKVVAVQSSRTRTQYHVAADLPGRQKAADTFEEIARRLQAVLQALDEQLMYGGRIKAGDGVDITENIRKLVKKHYKKPLPMAEYHNPSDMTIGSNSDKGSLLEMCLREKTNPSAWTPVNTLTRVALHEAAHSADFGFRADGEDGHGPVFKRIHTHLLKVAEQHGLYDCAEYKRSGRRVCGLVLSENYCG